MYIAKSYLSTFLKEYRLLILCFVIWKISLLAISFLVQNFLPFNPTYPYSNELISNYKHFFVYIWGGFDGVHYLNISQNGYASQFTQAFLPTYPILIKIFTFGFIPPLYVGVLINNICFLASLIVVKKVFTSMSISSNYKFFVILYFVFPTSFFFSAVYTEGLFLLLSVMVFYYFSKEKYFYTGLFGAIGSSVKLIGAFIFPVLIMSLVFVSLRKIKVSKNLFWLLIIPAGLIAYMVFLQIQFGDFLYFLHAQNYFGNARSSNFVLLPQVVFRYMKIFATVPIFTTMYFISVLELLSAAFFILIPLILYKKIPLNWLLYSLTIVVVPSLTGTFSSMPRYVLMSFPVFMLVSKLKPRYFYPIAFVLACLQVILFSLFASGTFVA